jgi:lipopolysaccharide export system permease protein
MIPPRRARGGASPHIKSIDRYIGGRFLGAFFLILLMLAVLFSFFELMGELDDVGRGAYRLGDAALYVALTLPKRLLDLMPISTLLGGIIALGMLADGNELLGMQAAGMSVMRISVSVLGTGMLLMAAAGLLAELAVPAMEQQACRFRARALSGADVTLVRQGFWARRNQAFLHVDRMMRHGIAADIDLFEFGADDRLERLVHARYADISDDRQWILHGVSIKRIDGGGFTTTQQPSLKMDSFLSTAQVDLLALPPYSLSTPDLMRYVRALGESGQNAAPYSLAFWRRIGMPLTTGAMVLLCLSFIFGPTRSRSAGHRITIGAFVGVLLYLLDNLSVHLGLLLGLPAVVTAMVPVVLISAIALWRLKAGT